MKGDKKIIVLFLLPMVLLTGMFLYYPFFKSIIDSFTSYNGLSPREFIGFDNYARLLDDKVIEIATRNSLLLMLYSVVFQVGIALILALLVDSIRKGRNFFRVTFFFPVVISGAAIGLLFQLIYGYDFGMMNNLLAGFGLDKVLWLSKEFAFTAIAIPIVWQYVGFYFVILTTAILKVPQEYYEAAKLEGITGIKKSIRITIPLIWGDLKICIILALTGALKVFEIVQIVTKGGPLNKTHVLGTYMYNKSLGDHVFGYGATIAVLIVLIGITVSLIVNWLLKREEVTY